MSEIDQAAKHRKRDGETYIAIGIFIAAVGLPVLVGTYWALASTHAAVVNAVCGATLLLTGAASIAYGLLVLRRHRREA